MKPELKGCPFCRAEPYLAIGLDDGGRYRRRAAIICCLSCHLQMLGDDASTWEEAARLAADRWNSRLGECGNE
jgi:hypothetical protein